MLTQHPALYTNSIVPQSATEEKAGLCEKLVLGEERQLELEAEVRGLKAAVVDAQTNAEQLEEMSRCVLRFFFSSFFFLVVVCSLLIIVTTSSIGLDAHGA